jgi:predicted unusual protein kinase regulating ubiquinone biosynthesis (AarF/ABC1/UbiB family)
LTSASSASVAPPWATKVSASARRNAARCSAPAAASAGVALARAVAKGDDVDVEAVADAVLSLGNLKGLAMKAGQMVSVVAPAMTAETRDMVALLQTASSATPLPVVQATLRSSLGARAEPLIATLSPAPIAVASVGQVHTATLPGPGAAGRAVVVKVRHPGIRAALDAELDVAAFASSFAGAFAPGVGDFVDEARAGFLGECDYREEARQQRRFAAIYADDADLVVPAVVDDCCADEVLVSDCLAGVSVFEAAAADDAARDRIGATLYRFFVGTLYRHRLLHADPHPGNFAVVANGRVVVYDFGCVRELAAAEVAALKSLARAVIDDDVDAMAGGLQALGGAAPTDAAGRLVLRRLLRGFFAPLTVAGPHALVADAAVDMRQTVADKRATARLRLPGRRLFLFRLRFGLFAVLARLGSVVDWQRLELDLSTR